MFKPYSLDVISHLPESKGRVLKKHSLNGEEFVGAFGNEPFEIQFRNNSWQKVQVRLSIDGTDILTGDVAGTDATGKMWVVQPYTTLSVKAWPETNKGGAAFVFTSAGESVAVNTHGNTTSRGVIAAAVFTEGHSTTYWTHRRFNDWTYSNDWTYGSVSDVRLNKGIGTLSNAGGGTYSSQNVSLNVDRERGLESLPGVGAGEQVKQAVAEVAGFISPKFEQVISLKYEWWTELNNAIKQANGQYAAQGFPADEKPIMSIGMTPRKDSKSYWAGNTAIRQSGLLELSRF